VSGKRLLRWNDWFYSGSGNFLQSSVQGIDLQITLGGGVGRYLRNTNQASFYVLGGFARQNAQYKTYTTSQGAQNAAAALLTADLKFFKFKKTNLDISAVVLPGISEPGRMRTNLNASYYVSSSATCRGTFRFMGTGTISPHRVSRAATMEPVLGSAGLLAIDSRPLMPAFSGLPYHQVPLKSAHSSNSAS
jgi:hypothetical protein